MRRKTRAFTLLGVLGVLGLLGLLAASATPAQAEQIYRYRQSVAGSGRAPGGTGDAHYGAYPIANSWGTGATHGRVVISW